MIFDLHAKLTTTRNGMWSHETRHARLMQCAQTLQVGAMFNCFLEGSMRPRKLALSDDLLMIALINTRTNKVTNAYEVLAISVSAGAHEDAKEVIGNSQLCFTMACADQIFTMQALNADLFEYWMGGIHLAQEMVMHKERMSEFEAAIAESSAKLHEAIQSQINYAFPKIFPESVEPASALTLIDEDGANGQSGDEKQLNTSDDEAALKSSGNTNGEANGDANAGTPAVEIAPPAALKMGRSLPRQPGYMSPSYDGALSPVRSPIRTLSPVHSNPSSPRPTPATSSLTDDSSPVASPSDSSLAKRASNSRVTEESTGTIGENGVSTAQSPIFEVDEHLRSPQTSHISSAASTTSPSTSSSETSHMGSNRVASKPIASKKLDFGLHGLAGTPSSASSYSPPTSDLATTRPQRIEGIPQSLDARTIVSGIANANLSSSHLSSTFDSLPSTPQTSEKIDDNVDVSTPGSSTFIEVAGHLDTPEKTSLSSDAPETSTTDLATQPSATVEPITENPAPTTETSAEEKKSNEVEAPADETSIAPESSTAELSTSQTAATAESLVEKSEQTPETFTKEEKESQEVDAPAEETSNAPVAESEPATVPSEPESKASEPSSEEAPKQDE